MNVLWQDARLVVVDKPSGLAVHPGWDRSGTHAMGELKAGLGRWVWPVHRLDRGTSGALAFALDEEAASILGAAFREHRVTKEYLALARGVVPEHVVVDHPVPKDEGSDERVDAVTEIERLAVARDRYSLVVCRPRTGRLHQIRRHLRHLRAPIAGDSTYGDSRDNRRLRADIGLARLALHASRLVVPHPDDARPIDVRAPLPPDLAEPLRRLGLDPAIAYPAEPPGR